MRISLFYILLLGSCTGSSKPPSSPELTPEEEYLFSFCEMDGCYSSGLRYLNGSAIVLTSMDSLGASTWIGYEDGTSERSACAFVGEVDGEVYCSSGPTVEETRVQPLSGEGPSFPIVPGFFLGCDPDGDGFDALCTPTGADQPPFDGVQDLLWTADVRLSVNGGLDIPGGEPLFWDTSPPFAFVGEPALLNVAPREIYTFYRRNRLEGRDVFLVGHSGGTSIVDALPPHSLRDLSSVQPSQTTFVGRFLPDREPVVLFLSDGGNELHTFEGSLLATVDLEVPTGSSGVSSYIVFDIDGDGVDELLYENGVAFYAFHFPTLP